MAGPEATFYRWLATKLTEFGCEHWDRIESSTSKGIPDLDICHKGRCTKVELKYEKGNQVHLRPEQRNWINKRIKAGGRVYILVKRQTAKVDQIEIYNGLAANSLYNREFVLPLYKAEKIGNSYNMSEMAKILEIIM